MKLQMSDKSVSRIAAAIAMLGTMVVCLSVGYGVFVYASTVSSAWDVVMDFAMVVVCVLGLLASVIAIAMLGRCVAFIYEILTYVTEGLLLSLRTKLAAR